MRHSESMVSYSLLDNRQVPAVTQCTALIDSDRAGSLRLTWHQIALELFGKFHCDVRNSNWRPSGMVATGGTHTDEGQLRVGVDPGEIPMYLGFVCGVVRCGCC